MEKTKKDKRIDRTFMIVVPLAKIWMFFDTKIKREYIDFSPKTTDPYIMLGNHTFMFDVVHVPLKLKKHPFIVANQNLYMKQPLKFVLNELAHTIPKSKGASDIKTAKDLIKSVRKNYPILIFPEGDTTFSGETNYIEESTMKLVKKLKVDVIAVKVSGGYLSKPRWATEKRKNRKAKMVYKTIIKKEELKDLTVEEISKIVNEELYHNDYEYQREVMIKHPGKNKALGLENILYMCPECNSKLTLQTSGDHIECTNCGTVGTVNDYGFIEGFKYDNTVDWDRWQKENNDDLRKCVFESSGKMFQLNSDDQSREFLGKVEIKYEKCTFYITGEYNLVVPLSEIKTTIITLRRNFNFIYNDISYLIKIEQFVTSFLRVAQNKY